MSDTLGGAPKRSDQDEEVGKLHAEMREDNEGKKKPFADFFEKLLLLIIGFALTSLLGGYLTNQFRTETAKTDFEVAAMQADLSRSVQVFESLSQLMDKRLYRMRRLHDVFAGNVGSDALLQRLSDYRAVLFEWNDNLNRYRSLYAFYFSSGDGRQGRGAQVDVGCTSSFEAVARNFADAHIELQKLVDKKRDGSEKRAQAMLDELNYCVYGLDQSMLVHTNDLRLAYRNKIANQ